MAWYLAGKMSGVPDHNFPAFRDAATQLRAAGREVLSPVEMDEEAGFDEKAGNVEPGSDEWADFLGRDVQLVASPRVEGLIVLPGWEDSRGAFLEVTVARELGKPVLTYPDLSPVKRPSNVQPKTDENVAEEAIRLVHGDRGDDYGPPVEDFARTASLWSTLFGWDARPEQVALAMVCVKLSRLVKSPTKRDSVADLCGYALTYEESMRDLGTPLA